MSTNDLGTGDVRAPVPPNNAPGSVTPQSAAAAMAAMPDPAVIARLASEFFAAIPGALGVTPVSGMAEPPATLPVQAGSSPDVPNLFSALGSSLPLDQLEALRTPPQDPATATIASPSGPSFYFLELTRSATVENSAASSAAPSMPPVTEYLPAPGSDLPALPNSPVGVTGLPWHAGNDLPGANPSGSSVYSLNGETSAPPNPVPPSLPLSEEFTFPGLPGMASHPSNSSVAASPVGEPDPPKLPDSLELAPSSSAESAGASPNGPAMPPVAGTAAVPGPEIPTVPHTPVVATGLPSQASAKVPEAVPFGIDLLLS
jgi:hypothetical protein